VLRQLARLGRGVPVAGGSGIAIAVYANERDEPLRAREAGYEGVACVDDAARALELYCDLWEATRLPWVLRWCEGLLDFVLAMQEADGRWLNFILDWQGTPNRGGRTSRPGGDFWQARALLALARASQVLTDPRIDAALRAGLPHVVTAVDVPTDVRALHLRTALVLSEGGNAHGLDGLLRPWTDELLRCRAGGVLMNSPDERNHPHLWGHIQEGVLADVGVHLGRPDLLDVARRSAELVFGAAVRSGFDLPRTQPYDVASAVHVLSRLAAVSGEPEYAERATAARAWFDGRNPAGQPVYDREGGRVRDGVDGVRVSTHSGAEANVVGAQALFDDAVTVARRLTDAEALPSSLR
jgi:hypothetical protein